MAVERGKDTDQMGGGKKVELAAREYGNVEEAGNGLPRGQRKLKSPGNGHKS